MVLKPSFSVLTVSKRIGWSKVAASSIAAQTAKPLEWVIVEERPGMPHTDIKHLYEANTEVVPMFAPESKHPSNLNASLNAGLRVIEAEYVIFYQDFIELPPDCFEKLMALATPDTFVTTCTPKYDGSDDGRYLGIDQPRPCHPEEWETNVAIAPMKMLRDIGGFDERLDVGWSWDNVNVALRAEMLGAKFILDESNRPKLLQHEQTSKLSMTTNGELNEQLIKDIRQGKAPLKLPFL